MRKRKRGRDDLKEDIKSTTLRAGKAMDRALNNAMGVCSVHPISMLRSCTVQHYWRYEGVGGVKCPEKMLRNT